MDIGLYVNIFLRLYMSIFLRLYMSIYPMLYVCIFLRLNVRIQPVSKTSTSTRINSTLCMLPIFQSVRSAVHSVNITPVFLDLSARHDDENVSFENKLCIFCIVLSALMDASAHSPGLLNADLLEILIDPLTAPNTCG